MVLTTRHAHSAAMAATLICEQCDAEDEYSCSCCPPDPPSATTAPAAIITVAPLARKKQFWPTAVRRKPKASTAALEEQRARSLLAVKIDMHQHCTACDDDGLATLLKANKACRVRCAVLLALRPPGSTVADVRRANDWVMSAAARHPSEIVPFITVLEDDPGASAMVREYASKGAKGVKLIGWAERYIKAHDYDLRSEAMLGVWAAAEELHLPVVAHISIGYDPSRYLADLQDILTKHPKLLLILAHFGLGFDSANLPKLRQLLHDHQTLHIDASLYGGAREKWLHRASNRAEALREVVMAFPNQVLFGTDAFGTKGRAESVLTNALRASCLLLECDEYACPELLRTAYFDEEGGKVDEGYGPRRFEPLRLRGLGLKEPALLKALLYGNAARILGL